MEGYDDVENDAFDAYDDATAGTAGRQEHEEPRDNLQMVRHVEEEEEADRNQLVDMGVFKPTSGNATKRLRMRQETRGTTRAGKTAEATLKQIATQEFQAEKGKMQIWKQVIMQEVAHELQAIRKTHEESLEAQRECFRVEMEGVTEKLEQMDVRSARLEREIGLLKAKEQTLGQHLGRDAPAIKKTQAQPKGQRKSLEEAAEPVEEEEVLSSYSPREGGSASALHLSPTRDVNKRNYASVAASKPAQAPERPWTQVVYKNRKVNQRQPTKSTVKIEHQGRRILFPREVSGQQASGQYKSEADLMLALNEALQKAGEAQDIRFSRVRYAPSGAISALLTEKADAGLLVPRWSNLLIRAAKSVDTLVVGVEILEHWQRLKVHGMPLERYLGDGKMDLLKREVESSTGIQLKTVPRWLVSENRLKEEQMAGNKRGSAIVITVKSEVEAKQLCASGLRFGHVIKKVEKYWEAGPSSVCMTCCGIGHERMGDCNNRPPKCIICAGLHKVSEHRCGVVGCSKGVGKSCIHVVAKCANCNSNHPANSPRCALRHEAEKAAKKGKNVRKRVEEEKEKARMANGVEREDREETPESARDMDLGFEDREETPESAGDMDLGSEEWAQSPEEVSQGNHESESRNHTADY